MARQDGCTMALYRCTSEQQVSIISQLLHGYNAVDSRNDFEYQIGHETQQRRWQ